MFVLSCKIEATVIEALVVKWKVVHLKKILLVLKRKLRHRHRLKSSSSKTIEVFSSSTEMKSSSSVNSERSSSSKLVESSSSKQMSSSSEGNAFVAGADQEYTPGKIYSSGLHNMEPGKCYSLNPERGTQRGWISTKAQDSWWWIETPCEKNGKGLYKRVSGHVGGESDAVLESFQTTRAYYNVLGRKMGRNKAFGVKQPVYSKKNSKIEDNLDN